MKIATLTTIPLLAAAALIPVEHRVDQKELEKRQFWDAVGASITKNLPGLIQWSASNLTWLLKWTESPSRFQQLTPAVDQRANKISLRYGPFTLTGANETFVPRLPYQMDPKSTTFIRTLKGIPWNAAILSARPVFTFEDGSEANFDRGVYVHHILIADLSKPSAPFALCPNLHKEDNFHEWSLGYILEAVGAGLVQVGNDAVGGANIFMPQKGNVKSAFLTGKDDLFGIQAEVVNYNPTNRTVFFNLELEYLEQKPADYMDASTIVVSATGCVDPGYRPPPGAKQYNHTSKTFDIHQNGFIVNARGHLHDGGTAIELWLNNKMICQSLPTYGVPKDSAPGTPKTILDMSWCHDSVPIKKGDALVLKTYYDLDKHPLRQSSATEAGHGHGGHGAHGEKTGGGGGGGMEGMEEMGIMTTNFAWEIPADAKQPVSSQQQASTLPATGSSTGSWISSLFGGSQSASPTNATTTATPAKDAKKEESGGFLSGLFGGNKKDEKAPAAKDAKPTTTTKTETQSNWFSNLFGASSPSPSVAAKKAESKPASPSSCSWLSSLLGCSETAAAPAPSAPSMNAPGGHSHR